VFWNNFSLEVDGIDFKSARIRFRVSQCIPKRDNVTCDLCNYVTLRYEQWLHRWWRYAITGVFSFLLQTISRRSSCFPPPTQLVHTISIASQVLHCNVLLLWEQQKQFLHNEQIGFAVTLFDLHQGDCRLESWSGHRVNLLTVSVVFLSLSGKIPRLYLH
jgi:hypothetical protein